MRASQTKQENQKPMKLTNNFHLSEFDSKDGSPMPEEVKANVIRLAAALQVVRDSIKVPIIINSGYRSPAHNEAVGGAPRSTHITGMGADIRARGMSPGHLFDRIEQLIKENKIPKGGLKAYRTWVHYDIRGINARW